MKQEKVWLSDRAELFVITRMDEDFDLWTSLFIPWFLEGNITKRSTGGFTCSDLELKFYFEFYKITECLGDL